MIGKKLLLLLTIVLILTLEYRVILCFGSGWSWPRIWYITLIRASLDLVDKNWLILLYQIASWLIRIDTVVQPNFIRKKKNKRIDYYFLVLFTLELNLEYRIPSHGLITELTYIKYVASNSLRMENHCPDNFFALTLALPTQRCVSIWFCPKLDFKVEISSIFVACLENLNFNYNLESRSGIQNPEKISLCRLLSAGTSTIGLSIVAARKFQPALESTWHRLWTHSWFLITSRQVDRFPIYCTLCSLNQGLLYLV